MIAFPFGEGVISVSSKDGTEMTDEVFKLICKVLVETRYYNLSAKFHVPPRPNRKVGQRKITPYRVVLALTSYGVIFV